MTSIGQQIHANGSIPGHRPQPKAVPLAGGGRHTNKTRELPAATRQATTAAPCTSGTYPPDLWFPSDYPGDTVSVRELVSREVCRHHCPLATRTACLDAAQIRGEPIDADFGGGVWGGLLGRDRAGLRTGRNWTPGRPPPPIPEPTLAELNLMLHSKEWARYLPDEAIHQAAARGSERPTRRAS
jgi:hypothetical protein